MTPTNVGQNVPMHNFPAGDWNGRGGVRVLFHNLNVIRGAVGISGLTYQSGVPVYRRVILIKQGPPAAVMLEMVPDTGMNGILNFAHLPAGKYIVIDQDSSGAVQGLIYDHVVAGP